LFKHLAESVIEPRTNIVKAPNKMHDVSAVSEGILLGRRREVHRGRSCAAVRRSDGEQRHPRGNSGCVQQELALRMAAGETVPQPELDVVITLQQGDGRSPGA